MLRYADKRYRKDGNLYDKRDILKDIEQLKSASRDLL